MIYKRPSDEDISYDNNYNKEAFMNFNYNGVNSSNISLVPSTTDSGKSTSSQYIRKAEHALSNLKLLINQPGWKKLLTDKNSGVVVYGKASAATMIDDDRTPIFRGEHIIKGFTPESIFAVIGMRKLWDDWYEEGNLVKNLNQTTSLTYMVMQALSGSKARDLSLVEKIECTLDGKIYFVSTSVNTSKIPHHPNRIRAHIYLNGWTLEPLSQDPPATRVNYILHTNVKGWVPSVVAKKYLSRRPLVIHTIETYLRKNGPPTIFVETTNSAVYDFTPTTDDSDSLLIRENTQKNDDGDDKESRKNDYEHDSLSSLTNTNDIIDSTDNNDDADVDNSSNKTNDINYNDDDNSNNNNNNATSSSSKTSTEITSITEFDDQHHIAETSESLPPLFKPTEPVQSNAEKSIPDKTTNDATATATPAVIQTLTASTITSSEKINVKVPEKDKSTHRHSEASRVAMDNFKSQVKSLDDWNFYSNNKGVKIYTKDVVNKSTPMIRGDTRISGGFNAEDILSMVMSFEMRKLWDERFEEGTILEKLNHFDSLVRSSMKGTFPISGRDLSLVSSTEYDFETGIVRTIATSVVDPLIPEVKRYVRAHLNFAGFEFIPEFDDNGLTKHVDIRYIVDIDIKLDTIPSSFLKQISIQTPMVLFKIDELLRRNGHLPYVIESTSQTSVKSYTINSKTFECEMEVTNVFDGAVTEIRISDKMYSNGYDLAIQPENVKVELSNKCDVVRIMFPSGNDAADNTNVLKIKIKRSISKGVRFSYNGGKPIPHASSLSSPSPSPLSSPPLSSPSLSSPPLSSPPLSSPSPSPLSSPPLSSPPLSSPPSSTLSLTSNKNMTKKSTPQLSSPRSVLLLESNNKNRDQNRNLAVISESINQNVTSNATKITSTESVHPKFKASSSPLTKQSISVTTSSIPPPHSTSTITVNDNSNYDNNDDNNDIINKAVSNTIISHHHQETSTSTLVEHLETKSKNNDEGKTIGKQISGHLTKTTIGMNGSFNSRQVGLMFTSMLLAYYAGKLSG